MRLVRVLVVAALAASSAALPAVTAHADPPAAPYTAFTVEGNTTDPAFARDDAFVGSAVAVTATTPDQVVQFQAQPADPAGQGAVTLQLSPAAGESLATGTATIAGSGSPGTVELSIVNGVPGYCTGSSGTVVIDELGVDATSGAITSFAGSYGVNCQQGQQLQGQLRWRASEGYTAFATSPRNWDFGQQRVKAAGTSKAITFANVGTNPITFDQATVTGDRGAFSIVSDDCLRAVAPGTSCTVTVQPHPQVASSATNSYSVGTLTLSAVGLAPRIVALREIGTTTPTTYVAPGANRITANWGQLPAIFSAQVSYYRVYRGTSATRLAYLGHTTGLRYGDSSVTPGRTYYYAVRPVFTDGSGGDVTPPVAAIAWPKYSAGMYHRFASSARLVNARTITAARPYTLKVLGLHGIPRSGVSAVVLDVLGSGASTSTGLTVYPYGSRRPSVADLVLSRGTTQTNLVVAQVGRGGRIVIAGSRGTARVSLDVFGFYSARGLATSYGSGGALQENVGPGVILDTRRYGIGAVPTGYYIDAPVNFAAEATPHVSSLVVQVTAYGSRAGGTVTAYATNGRAPATTVLAYGAGQTATNTAIVTAGRFHSSSGRDYPSVAFLNRGRRPVQLIVSVIGFYDDNTMVYGQRYTPSAATHLLSASMRTGTTRLIDPRSHANLRTTALNLKVAVAPASRTTSLALWAWGIRGVGRPANPQVRATAHQGITASTVEAVGVRNRIAVRNATGSARISVWLFGRFDYWPVAAAHGYLGVASSPSVVAARPARTDQVMMRAS